MKKFLIAGLIVPFMLSACARKAPGFKMEAGMPEYELAGELSAKLKILDPEANAALIETDRFEVTVGDLIQTIRSNMGNQTEQLKNLEADQLRQIVQRNMQLLGERKMLLAEADKAGVKLDPEHLNGALQDQYQQAGGEEQFRATLEQRGVSFDYVRGSISEGLRIQSYLDGILEQRLEVSEEDLREIHQQDKTASVRHILLLTQGKNEEEKTEIRQKMEGILERVRSGEDFAALAKEYTEDPGSKENGGLYEDFGRGRMVKPFEDAAFTVPVGEISDIVETEYGYHILQIVDRKKETRPFDEVREELAAQVRQGRESGILQEHLEDLKKAINWQAIEF